MKKHICLFLVLLLLILNLTGCAEKRASSDQPVTLTLWHNYGAQMKNTMDNLVDEFNETVGTENGIIISVTSISSSAVLHEKLMMAANGDPGAPSLPDITTGYPKTAVNLAAKGMLADLDQFVSPSELDAYIPQFIEEGRLSDDKLYIFPTAKSTEVLFVNETLFARFAQDKGYQLNDLSTVEGLLEAAEDYYYWTDQQTPTIPDDGKTFFTVDSLHNFTLVGCEQLGSSYYKDGRPDMSTAEFKQVWNALYIPALQGYSAIFAGYGSDLAKTGDIVCSLGSTAGILFFSPMVTYADNSSEEVQYAILPYPIFEGGRKVAVQRGGGMFVTKSTKEKEQAASIFLKWFTQPEQNLRFITSTGYLPVTKAAFDKVIEQEITDQLGPNIKKLLLTATEMQQNYDFYIPPTFEGVDELQSNFEKQFKELALADKEKNYKEIIVSENNLSLEQRSQEALTRFNDLLD